ncbi:hypothetical protein DRQ18_01855, partial [bacterium]
MRKWMLLLIPAMVLMGARGLQKRKAPILPPVGAEKVPYFKGTPPDVKAPVLNVKYAFPVDTAGSTTYDWQTNGNGKQYIAVDYQGGVHMCWIWSNLEDPWT